MIAKNGNYWQNYVRDKLNDVFCMHYVSFEGKPKVRKYIRPGIIYDFDSSKAVDAHRYSMSDVQLTKKYLGNEYIMAVRQQKNIKMLILDIDAKSIYRHDYKGIVHCLEEIGLCRYQKVISSFSGGVHLFFGLNKPVLSEFLHIAIKAWLQHRGFVVKDGVLEIFPCSKNTLYHNRELIHLSRCFRLPLQAGSYLVDEDDNYIHSDIEKFWKVNFDLSAEYQDYNSFDSFSSTYSDYISGIEWTKDIFDTKPQPKANKPKKGRISRVEKELEQLRDEIGNVPRSQFIDCLKARVDQGWTDQSQSNYLIGAVAIILAAENYHLDEKAIAKTIRHEVKNMVGFSQYASDATKKDLANSTGSGWSRRWAKSVVKYRQQLIKNRKL